VSEESVVDKAVKQHRNVSKWRRGVATANARLQGLLDQMDPHEFEEWKARTLADVA
jgi:hypothetical protein